MAPRALSVRYIPTAEAHPIPIGTSYVPPTRRPTFIILFKTPQSGQENTVQGFETYGSKLCSVVPWNKRSSSVLGRPSEVSIARAVSNLFSRSGLTIQ